MVRESSNTGPLHGYRVLDLATEMGAYGTKVLADMGADVLKVEPPQGDPARKFGPFYEDRPSAELSLFFAYMNSSKRGITLDLDRPEGMALFRKLVEQADVLYETFPPGHLAWRGLGHDLIQSINPDMVITSVSPFGHDGPYRHWKGSDLICWALSGLLNTVGDPDRPPVVPGGLLAFILASVQAAAGTLLALRARRSLGRGQRVEISVQEAAVAVSSECGVPSFLDDGIERKRTGNRRQMQAPVGHFAARDGAACFVVAMPTHWDAMAKWVYEETGNTEVLNPMFRGGSLARVPVKEAVNYFVEQLALRYTKQQLFEEGQKRGIPITPVNTSHDIANDPHLKARGYWVEVPQPSIGTFRYPGAPYRLSRSPWRIRRPAPTLGEHNEEIYCGQLGLRVEELASLRAANII